MAAANGAEACDREEEPVGGQRDADLRGRRRLARKLLWLFTVTGLQGHRVMTLQGYEAERAARLQAFVAEITAPPWTTAISTTRAPVKAQFLVTKKSTFGNSAHVRNY